MDRNVSLKIEVLVTRLVSDEEVRALIERAEDAGFDFYGEDWVDTDERAEEAIRVLFADHTGPDWLIHQPWCGGWAVDVAR